MKKKIYSLICVITTMGIVLTGCTFGDNSQDAPGMKISKDLSIEAIIVDDFDESLYDITELQAMINDETSQYNGLGTTDVTPKDVAVTDGRVKVVIDYADADAYADFNGRYFKLQTIDEALTDGIPSIAFKSVKDGSLADPRTFAGDDSYYLCVTDEPGDVSFPGKVQFISDGVETITRNSVKVTENMDGLAYIIFTNK